MRIVPRIIFCLFCLLFFLGGINAQAKPLRMAYLQNDIHHLALWVALEKGFFQEENVDVQIAGAFNAGPEVMSAFAAGALDMAYVGAAPTTVAVANKATDVVIVAQVNTEGSAVVVGKDSAFDCSCSSCQELSALQGKTVAVPGHSTVQDFLLRKGLAEQGLQPNDAHIMVLKPPEMISALRNKQIDAFVAWEPYPARANTSCVGCNFKTSADIWPEHPCCALVVSRDYLQANQEAVLAVLRAHIKGTRFITQNPEQAVQIGAEFSGMDQETIRQALHTVHYTTELSIQGQLEYVRFLSEIGYINIDDPESFVHRLIDPVLLEKILNE